MVFRVAGGTNGGGAASLANYGCFVSTANQTNPVASTANPVTLNTQIDGLSGMTNTNGLITFTAAGAYMVTIELAFTSSTGANPVITQWLVKNGANLANSGQDFQLLGGANTVQMGVCTFLISALVNDTIQVYWSSSNTNVSLAYQAAAINPTRPASPSAIVCVHQVG